MDAHKKICLGIVFIILTALLASPALAHRKYRRGPTGHPRSVSVRHTHGPEELAKPATPVESETLAEPEAAMEPEAKEPGLVDNATGFVVDSADYIITGTFKTLDNIIEGVFGSEEEPES